MTATDDIIILINEPVRPSTFLPNVATLALALVWTTVTRLP
jgi:hypothetical protein